MLRRAMILLIAIAVSFSGYSPSFAMSAGMAAPAAQDMSMAAEGMDAHADCAKSMQDDCCGKGEQKSNCVFDDACAARCHVNAGLAAMMFAPVSLSSPGSPPVIAGPRAFHPARAGPYSAPRSSDRNDQRAVGP
jgi:hypothetical protein